MKNLLPFLFLISVLQYGCQDQSPSSNDPPNMNPDELLKTLGEIYLYGYPLVLSDLTRRRITSVAAPLPDLPLAPLNQLGHYRKFPDPTTRAVVKPNVDTYYSISWFDLGEEPQLLTVPATERYYVMQFLDAYSNIIGSVSPRTNGTGMQRILIVGRDWQEEVDDDITVIQSPTNLAWLLGRIQVNDVADGATTVRTIQDGITLRPWNQRDNPDFRPEPGENRPTDQQIIPVQAIQDLGMYDYLNRLAELLVDNPPLPADSAILDKMLAVGLVPGKPFDLTSDNFMLRLKLKGIPNVVHQKFNERRSNPDPARMKDNWLFVTDPIGDYGTDYRFRAYISYIAFGANLPEDAVYPNTSIDSEGRPLNGRHAYRLHFAADELPPVHAFWSLTAYDANEFLIANELNRYALGDRSELQYNADGSLDIYLQHEPPAADLISNWLPVVEAGQFYLTLRLYWPKEEVLAGEWRLPEVKRMD